MGITMGKTIIKLVEQPHVDGYDGAFLSNIDNHGKTLITGWWDFWYTALAQDADGKQYAVYWVPSSGEFDPNNDDEEDCCDWEKPIMVITEDENGRDINVLSKVELVL